MTEKPLHVQAAEGLGWKPGRPPREPQEWVVDDYGYFGAPPPGMLTKEGHRLRLAHVPRYDTDWSATGPLIEKYNIQLHSAGGSWFAIPPGGWLWFNRGPATHGIVGPTPLVAACRLLSLLKEGPGKTPASMTAEEWSERWNRQLKEGVAA